MAAIDETNRTSPQLRGDSRHSEPEKGSFWSRHRAFSQLIALCFIFSLVNTILIKGNLGKSSKRPTFVMKIRRESRQQWRFPTSIFRPKRAVNGSGWNSGLAVNDSRIHELYSGVYPQQHYANHSELVPVCVVASNHRQRSLFSSGLYSLALGTRAEFAYHVHEPSYCLHRGSCSSYARAQHPDCHELQPTIVLNDHTRCCHKARFSAIQRMIASNYFDLAIVTGDEYCDVRRGPKTRRLPHHYRQYHFAKRTVGYLPLGPRNEFRRVDPTTEILTAWHRKYLFNFVGSLNTNRVRASMLMHIQEWLTTTQTGQMINDADPRPFFLHSAKQWTGVISQSSGHIDPEEYRNVLLQSAFTLCPSGHNPESYRIYEAIEAGSVPILALDRSYQLFDCEEAFAPFIESNAPFPMLGSWKQIGTTLERAIREPAWVVELQINCTVWLRQFMKVHAREFQDRLKTRWNYRLLASNMVYEKEVVAKWSDASNRRKTYFGKSGSSFNYGGAPSWTAGYRSIISELQNNYSFWGVQPLPENGDNSSEAASFDETIPVCVVSFTSKGAGIFFENHIDKYSSGRYSYKVVTYARRNRACPSGLPTIFISNYAEFKKNAFKKAAQDFDVTILTADDRCRSLGSLTPHFRQFYSESRINPFDGGTEQGKSAALLPFYIPLGPRTEFIATMQEKPLIPTSKRRLLFSFAGSATSAARKSIRKLNLSEFGESHMIHFTDSFAAEPKKENGYLDLEAYSRLLRESKFALVPGKADKASISRICLLQWF